MNESQSLKVGGAMTWWSCGKFVQRAPLLDALTYLDLNKYAPGARTPIASLRSALEEIFPTRSMRVEHLVNRQAFEVVEIIRGETANDYRSRWWVGIDKDLQVEVKPYDLGMGNRVVSAFNKHKGLVTANEVTNALLQILGSLQGTYLRQKGGVYWLPGHQVDTWRLIACAVEGVPTQGEKNQVHLMTHQWGPDEVRAVKDAITREVESEAHRLHSEILPPEGQEFLGEKALEHRKCQAEDLARKVQLYEELLGTGLDSLKATLERVSDAACNAALLIAAGAPSGKEVVVA